MLILSLITQSQYCPCEAGLQQPLTYGDTVLDHRWESYPWTGDDRPFAESRRSIDRLFKTTADVQAFVQKFQRIAEANPNNALDQFQWAYAFFLQGIPPHPVARDATRIAVELATAPDPHTYNYTRLRLLYEPPDAANTLAEERLLSAEPNDYLVQEIYSLDLSISKVAADDKKAVSIAEGLARTGWGGPDCYLNLADVYFNVGWNLNEHQYYTKSIAASQEFLASTPSYDWKRAAALHSINYLEKQLAANKR